MSESIYDQVKNRIANLLRIYSMFVSYTKRFEDKDPIEYYNNHPELEIISKDRYKVYIEIDQFVKEYPDTYKIYFDEEILPKYKTLLELINKQLQILNNRNPENKWLFIEYFKINIEYIINHLEELLNPETAIQQQPKPITPPKGQTVLTREQTALLFWYLREKSLIAPRVTNQNLATAIDLMTGFKKKQIAEILKMPDTDVSKLGKDEDKVTQNDFRIIISQLKMLIVRIENDLKTNQDIKE